MAVFKQVPRGEENDMIDMKDLPKDKVERKDGLPTVDDLKEIFGKEKKERSEGDELKDFIEIIIRIDK